MLSLIEIVAQKQLTESYHIRYKVSFSEKSCISHSYFQIYYAILVAHFKTQQ